MDQEVRNPDPAWPDVIAVLLFGLIILGGDAMSSWKLGHFFEVNWWPALRIVLWVWVPLRAIDLLRGGPSRRWAMRIAYRNMKRAISARARSS